MTLLDKLTAYRNALHQWRAANDWLKHCPRCERNQEPQPSEFGLCGSCELTMAANARDNALNLTVRPGKTVETRSARSKRTV